MTRSYTIQVTFLALSAALLLASTQVQRPEGWSVAGLYGYWSVRILIEAALFIAFAELFSRLRGFRSRIWLTAILAAVVSLVPFALSITTLDLILGLPELDGAVGFAAQPANGAPVQELGEARVTSFLLELVYLSDNHLALCLLLTAPKLFFLPAMQRLSKADETASAAAQVHPGADGNEDPIQETPTESAAGHGGNGYQRHLERPLQDPLLRVEAQEHYVRLISQSDSRMLLYRFNDIVAELSDELGMQVHRSHWVAYAAIAKSRREGGRLWLALKDGSSVPVSRKYADEVQEYLSRELANAKKAAS